MSENEYVTRDLHTSHTLGLGVSLYVCGTTQLLINSNKHKVAQSYWIPIQINWIDINNKIWESSEAEKHTLHQPSTLQQLTHKSVRRV